MKDDFPFRGTDQALLAAAQNLVRAVNGLNETLSDVFPIGGATSTSANAGSAGAPPAQVLGYLAVTLPDGTAVKIPYYAP